MPDQQLRRVVPPGTADAPCLGPLRAASCRGVPSIAGRARASLLVAMLCWAGRPVAAQVTQGAADTANAGAVSPASPRAAVEQFLALARAGRHAAAADYLALTDSTRQHGPALARQLQSVLDRRLWIDPEQLSGASAGDTTDRLGSGIEQLGTIPTPGGVRVPVRLVRSGPGDEIGWRFSRGTLAQVPVLYEALPGRRVMELLPGFLLVAGPYQVPWWQWIALPFLLALSVPIGWALHRLVTRAVTRVVARTPSRWDDAVASRLGGPVRSVLVLTAFVWLVPLLVLVPPAAMGVQRVTRAGYFVLVFWATWRLVDVVRAVLSESAWARESASSRGLLPLAARVAKALVVAVASVAVLSMLGFPVASLLAGLGLGGLAFALAAQKTVENLFGAFSLGVDQPFREGDDVKVGEVVGTVEKVGLRSTRLRTPDRSVVTVPNGQLADARIESLTARDRLRLSTVIGLEYGTTAAQMREVLSGFERVLRSHPLTWPDLVIVRFREFAASSLDVEVIAWFQVQDVDLFRVAREEVLLQFMEVVERAGTRFAFPSRTLHIASMPEGIGRPGKG